MAVLSGQGGVLSSINDEFIEEFNLRGPSKSSRKRESTALQDLGEELMALSPQQLEQLDLPDALKEAVLIGQGIRAHGGLARQRKYIGKILRGLDASPIRAGLMALRGESAAKIRQQHQAESWRDRMLADGDPAVNDFVARFPTADRQRLRRLVKDSVIERERALAPKSARLLFRTIRECLEESVSVHEEEIHNDE